MKECSCGGVDIGVGVVHEPSCDVYNDGRIECRCGYLLSDKDRVCPVCGDVVVEVDAIDSIEVIK